MTDKEVNTSRIPRAVGKNGLNDMILFIQEGNREKAFQLFSDMVSHSLRGLLSKRYRWKMEEADSLIHDTYLILEEKVLAGSVSSINYSYIKRTCLNLGANQYRHALVQEGRYQKYLDQARDSYVESIREYSGIELQLLGESSAPPLRYKKALMAYEQLDEKSKQIIYLRHVKALSHKEIASELSHIKNADSSKTLLNRGMKKWSKILQGL